MELLYIFKIKDMVIPPYLAEQIRAGNVVLFFGSGASYGATSKYPPLSPPLGNDLANLLSDKFLGGDGKDKPLSVIAEYCAITSDLRTVETYIRDIFSTFEPSPTHIKIAGFKWAALITTNYDQIVERAYLLNKGRLQNPVPILRNTDRVDNELKVANSVQLIKLHGCIGMEHDDRYPLILTIEQYVNHRKGRDKLFSRFTELAGEYPVIYVGYQLEDPDIRAILQELDSTDMSRPRHYVVTPHPTELDKKVWESKRIESITGTFDEFIAELDLKIPKALRGLKTTAEVHLITSRFITHNELSESAQAFLANDVMYIFKGMRSEAPNSASFFRGASYGWASIIAEFDSKRNLTETILSETVVIDDSDRPRLTDVYLLKGYAGSGKTVTFKRIAYETATSFEKPVIFIRADGRLLAEPVEELCRSLGERLYIFIDGIARRSNEIEAFIKSVRVKNLQLTVYMAERTNEWNTDCQTLSQLIDDEYELRSLSGVEVNLLLDKLEKHNALGDLINKTPTQRQQAFLEYADRQLLVALYEVTSGEDFPVIVFNEYRNILNDRARSLYLVVCALNRLNVPVRAGLVKRVTGINYIEFKADFFLPLESIVLAETYKPAADMAYRARHPWIAQIVFERALPTENERFDLYLSLIQALDVGYTPDRVAYREMIRAKNILEIFPTPNLANLLFDAAAASNDRDGYLYQQRAIYEMKRPNPNYQKAHELLVAAREYLPNDRSITHSMSELEMARANNSQTEIEKNHHLNQAKSFASTLVGMNATSSHGYSTLIRLQLDRFKILLKKGESTDQELAAAAKNVEQELTNALQHFRTDEFILASEAEFSQLLNNEQRAFKALDTAYKSNPASLFVSKALSRLLDEKGDFNGARATLIKTLQQQPGDKGINGALAKLLDNRFPQESNESESYWRRSYTVGDTNYTSQLQFARRLYLNGKYEEAKNMFATLKLARVSRDIKTYVNDWIIENGTKKVFTGSISRTEDNFAIIAIRGQSKTVMLTRNEVKSNLWSTIKTGNSIEFHIGFNYFGPAASAKC